MESQILGVRYTDPSINLKSLDLFKWIWNKHISVVLTVQSFSFTFLISQWFFLKNNLIFNIQANGAYPDWKDRKKEKKRKKENFLHLTQVETRLWATVLFLVLYEFLAESWKKQMFISSSSSAFIYIYVPFQYGSSLLIFVGSKTTGDRSTSEQSWDKNTYESLSRLNLCRGSSSLLMIH